MSYQNLALDALVYGVRMFLANQLLQKNVPLMFLKLLLILALLFLTQVSIMDLQKSGLEDVSLG